MGYIKHNSIIVTTYDEEIASKAHKKAIQIFSDVIVSELKSSLINNWYSFAVLPDGSKEGWDDSDRLDVCREQFRKYIKSLDYEDGSNPLDWVEVSFDEEGEKEIVL